jgi:hypothetical protein
VAPVEDTALWVGRYEKGEVVLAEANLDEVEEVSAK